MNSEKKEREWQQLRGNPKKKYTTVLDDDTTYTEGEFEDVLNNRRSNVKKSNEVKTSNS